METEVICSKDSKKRKLIVDEQEKTSDRRTNEKFSGIQFRVHLKGDHPLGAIRQLLAVVQNTNNDNVVNEFLENGGTAHEVISALDKLENKTYYHHYQPVFSLLTIVITKCRDELPKLQRNTEEACKRLLNTNTPALHAMLAPASLQAHKKTVLQMLTAMVVLSEKMARDVLTSLSLREGTVNDLAKHPLKYEPNNVRAHFMRYVLSFFYHNSTHLAKQMLDQRHLMQSLILISLTNDEAPILSLFLTTLKEKIVEDITISKTIKRKMFNTKIMTKLLETYTWRGPEKQKKKGKENKDILVTGEEKEEVINRLHQLLVLLCTNHKFGLAFVDPSVGLDKTNYNELLFSVVKAMDPYWSVSWVRDLAVEIVTACPDLVVPTFRHFGLRQFFDPQVSYSFSSTCEFAQKVLERLCAERCLVRSGSPDQLTHLTIRVVFNMNVLGCVRSSLLSIHPTLRLRAIQLLSCAFQALHRFLNQVKSWFTNTPRNWLEYKQRVFDYITKNVGLEEELMVSWSLGVGGDQSILKVPTETEYFLPLLDLLLSYTQLFPVYLPPVFLTQLQSTTLDTLDIDSNQRFTIKIIKLITVFKSIQPTQPQFKEMVKALVPFLGTYVEAKEVLKSLLVQTGLFESVECEVDTWVRNLAQFPTCESHLPLLLATLDEGLNKPKGCVKLLRQANSLVTSTTTDQQYDWDQLIQVAKDSSEALPRWEKMIGSTRISLMVPALLRVLQAQPEHSCTCKLISHIMADILFSQVDITPISHLIDSCSSQLMDPVKKYIIRWKSDTNEFKFSKHLPFNKCSTEYQMINILASQNLSETEIPKLLETLSEETTVMCARLAVFHVIHVSTEDLVDRTATVVCSLVRRLPDSAASKLDCLQEVFLHPVVLQIFNPLQTSSILNSTALVMSLIEFVSTECQWLLKPYKERFLKQINKTIKKRKKLKTVNILEVCDKLVTEQHHVVALLSSISEIVEEFEVWSDLTHSLLQKATSLKCLLPEQVVANLTHHPVLHSSLAHYLAVFPHLLQCVDQEVMCGSVEEVSELCRLLVRTDRQGTVQRKLAKHNKQQPAVIFSLLTAAAGHWDTHLLKHADNLLKTLLLQLTSSSLPFWLTDNSKAIASLLSQLSGERCEEVFGWLESVDTWTETHLDLARPVCVKLGRQVQLVKHTLRVLIPLTSESLLARAEPVCRVLREVVEEGLDWKPVADSEDWTLWSRLALKLGETSQSEASFLLSTLCTLCAAVYRQNPTGSSAILEMLFSHSQFLKVMLAKPSSTKDELLRLIVVLLQLDSSKMKSNHIPIYLAAYSASLSISDQLILQIVQLYEKGGGSLDEWKPLLWGETAASFYSVRSQITPGLWNKKNFHQLMDLFDEHRVDLTISNFPVGRNLWCAADESGCVSDVYDPAFYLPLLVSIFSPSEMFFTYKTCQSGCLSLILAALSSNHQPVRACAYVALQRFHCHLLSNTNNQDTLWLHFLGALRRGLGEGDAPRLSSIVSVFLARTALVLTNPAHPLYLPLSQFVLAKPRFSLDTVPELLPLFNSADTQLHNTHQEWILKTIKDGLKDSRDFSLCLNSMVLKIVLEYFSSVMASDKSKVLILEIVQRAVSIQGASSLLLASYSLYPWLHSVTLDPSLPASVVTPLLSLLACPSLLHRSSAPQLVPLLLHLAPSLSSDQLTPLLSALLPHCSLLTHVDLLRLCDIVENTCPNVIELRTMLDYGVKFVEVSSTVLSEPRGYLKQIIVNVMKDKIR